MFHLAKTLFLIQQRASRNFFISLTRDTKQHGLNKHHENSSKKNSSTKKFAPDINLRIRRRS